jgi:hypothetical protein
MLFVSLLLLPMAATAWLASSRIAVRMSASSDPNFEAHLGAMLKKGLEERPSADLGAELRSRYKSIAGIKREAAKELLSINTELAAEVRRID